MVTTIDLVRYRDAARRFRAFFLELEGAFAERKDVLSQVALGLLAREHVLLTGPPGTAKSRLASAVFGRILSEEDGKPSLFSRQITESTVHTDLVGPLDFKNLMETGRSEHFTDDGILGSVHAFLDEVFDGRDMLLRSALNLLQERELKEGSRVAKGRIECALMTSNRYVAQVLEESRLTLLAFVDRIAFVGFVPRGFADPKNLERVLQREVGRAGGTKLDALLTIQDLDVLQSAVDAVVVPPDGCAALAALVSQLDRELAAATRADPAFSPTRYLSTRTAVRAGAVLRAAVVWDHVMRDERSLVVSRRDFEALRLHLVLAGPGPSEVEALLAKETDALEKRQLQILRTEREVFDRCLEGVPVIADPGNGPRFAVRGARVGPPPLPDPEPPAAPPAAAAPPALEAVLLSRYEPIVSRGDVPALVDACRELAPHVDPKTAAGERARELLLRAVGRLEQLTAAAVLATELDPSTDPVELAGKLAALAQGIRGDSQALHALSGWLRERALAFVNEVALGAVGRRAAVLVVAPKKDAPWDVTVSTIESPLVALELLTLVREDLGKLGGGAQPVADEAWRAGLETVARGLGAAWDAVFCVAVERAFAAKPKQELRALLERVRREFEWLGALATRLEALGGDATLLRRVAAGGRASELVRGLVERVATVDREKLAAEVGACVELLEHVGLSGAVSLRDWLAWWGGALIAEESQAAPAEPDGPATLRGYRTLRRAAHRLPVTAALCAVALRLVPEAREASAFARVGAEMAPDLAERAATLDLDRTERTLAYVARWLDETLAGEPAPAPGEGLERAIRSGVFDVLWDEAALVRIGVEIRLVEEVFPSTSARCERLRALATDLARRADEAGGALLRERNDRAFRRALGAP